MGKITALDAITSAALADLLVIVDDVGVTPTTKKITVADLFSRFTFHELSADPSDPAEGYAVMWMSDGTGAGDDGDVLLKITAGGATKTATLVDFSTL
jgi:hypothetical protein